MSRKLTCMWLSTIMIVVSLAAFSHAQQSGPPDAVAAAQAALKAAQDAAAKTAAAAATADKSAAESTAAKSAADKTLAEKSAAAKAAADQAAAAKAAAAKAAAEKGAAEKAAADLANAAKAATDKATAARTAATNAAAQVPLAAAALAHTVARKATDDKSVAENALNQKIAAVNAATTKAAAEKATADRATAEAAAAKATAEKAAANDKAAAEKIAADKAAAAKAALEKATAAQAATEKAIAERTAAEQAVAQRVTTLRSAQEQAAITRSESLGGLKTVAFAAWDYAKARHLLWRAGFGGTPDEVARLHAMGPQGAVDFLVNYTQQPAPLIPFEAFPPERPLPYESKLSADEQNKVAARRQREESVQLQGTRACWLKRMAESPRPLQEKLTLFWHGHFACQYEVVLNSYMMYKQNQLFRQHAAGNFGALLRGIVHDPTMIRYLNNDSNVKGRANENLACEIMELFSMGTGNYTEQDIREASKALTGYTYDWYTGEFRFVKSNHDDGPKTIWGRTGNFTGDDLVDLILQQPATARFIARKLFLYFAHENPSEATVNSLANVLRASGYELSVMLENLFLSDEFYSAQAMATQIKSPAQLLVGTLRSLGIKDANYAHLDGVIRNMGQDLLEPPNVKGWNGGRSWIDANRIFHRYNAVADVIETVARPNGQRGVDLVGTLLAGKNFQNPAEVVDFFTNACLLGSLTLEKRQALIDFVATLPPCAEWTKRKDEINARLAALLVQLLSSPEYQLG